MLQSVRKEGEHGNLHDDREVAADAAADADSDATQHEVKLSVIIPCLNAERTIGEQLAALAGQRWPERWEVIVADNGSTDGTLAVVRSFADRLPGLRVVDASQRRGSGYARNRGAAAARGEWLAFCDADDVVAPGWVAAMGAALARHEFVASRFRDDLVNDPQRAFAQRLPQQDGLQQYKYPRYLPHAGGSGLGIRAALHRAVGGFDESFLRLQDTDYCWRVQLHGAALHFAPEAVVHCRMRSSALKALRQAYLWGEYNVRLYAKYRAHGMPRLTLQDGARQWLRLLRQARWLTERGWRERWLWRLSWRLGRISGSIKYRVLGL